MHPPAVRTRWAAGEPIAPKESHPSRLGWDLLAITGDALRLVLHHQIVGVDAADAGSEVPAGRCCKGGLVGVVVRRQHADCTGRQIAVVLVSVAVGLTVRIIVTQGDVVEDARTRYAITQA